MRSNVELSVYAGSDNELALPTAVHADDQATHHSRPPILTRFETPTGGQVVMDVLELENFIESPEIEPSGQSAFACVNGGDGFASERDVDAFGGADYNTIAGVIARNWTSYTGFVVLHGTDTMVSASA